MTTKDTLALALEALEYAQTGNRRPEIIGAAITAIKQAQVAPMWDVERLESARQQANQSPTSLAAQAVYINGLEYELARLQAQQAQEPVAWVWNPAKESWEQVRAFGHWQQGAIYAFGPNPPAPKQAEPKGYKLVPVEPTKEMCAAGRKALSSGSVPMNKVYSAMLAAAPTPTGAK